MCTLASQYHNTSKYFVFSSPGRSIIMYQVCALEIKYGCASHLMSEDDVLFFSYKGFFACRRACGALVREAPRLFVDFASQIMVVQRLLHTTPHNITRSGGRRQASECCAVTILLSRILSRPWPPYHGARTRSSTRARCPALRAPTGIWVCGCQGTRV